MRFTSHPIIETRLVVTLVSFGLFRYIKVVKMTFLILIIFSQLSLSSCQEVLNLLLDEQKPKKTMVVLQKPMVETPVAPSHPKMKEWSEVIRDQTSDPVSFKDDESILHIEIENPHPYNEVQFDALLMKMIKALIQDSNALFKVYLVKAQGPEKMKYSARIYQKDFKSYLQSQISEPELYRRMDRTTVDTVDSLRIKATVARNEGNNEAASHYLVDWLDKDPYSVRALALLGNVYRDLKKYDEAIKYYTKLKELNVLPLFVSWNLGFVNERLGFYEQSISFFKQACSLDPSNELLARQLAHVNYLSHDFNGGMYWITKALGMHKTSPGYLIEGNLYRFNKQFDKAQKSYEKASEIDSKNQKALFNLILADLDLKKFDLAKKHYTALKNQDEAMAKELEVIEFFKNVE